MKAGNRGERKKPRPTDPYVIPKKIPKVKKEQRGEIPVGRGGFLKKT